MRHRRKGRTLGRCPSHQRALLRNLASALILTERDAEDEDNRPKVKGRIITTLQKAKEVRPLVERFQKNYERAPKVFDEDPMVAFKRCIHVHPFHEEDPIGLVKLIGPDNVLFGSDFPHPEGMYDPVGFVDQLEGLPEEDKAKVMGGNLNRIMKVAA